MAKFLFVTDLDHTLVGDDAALSALNQQLQYHREEHGTMVVYATGRSPTLYQALRQQQEMLDPDYAVLAVGTLIYPGNSTTALPEWADYLSLGWDRDAIVAIASQCPDLVSQPQSEQTPHKVSYFLDEAIAPQLLPQLAAQLRDAASNFQLVYSGSQYLDILPKRGNKGTAVGFLQEQLAIAPERTVVCGDSGNDLSMFTPKQSKGIIVGNARPELRAWYQSVQPNHVYLATGHYANGILEGLIQLGFLKE
ncbi:MAG: sucrose-phosphate phosphatase [Cyanothece sp. SIO2G6]|nr:sucrose-phosphate phosphatase [Cyanothece sp. SIO2G6]